MTSGIALESKSAGDVRVETDSMTNQDGDHLVLVRFSQIDGLSAGKIILTPEEAEELARGIDAEIAEFE